jgi:hypothetical protein
VVEGRRMSSTNKTEEREAPALAPLPDRLKMALDELEVECEKIERVHSLLDNYEDQIDRLLIVMKEWKKKMSMMLSSSTSCKPSS